MTIKARTPVRISFAGGGTDVSPFPEMEGGCVVSATIARYVYGSLSPRNDTRVSIQSDITNMELEFPTWEAMMYDGKLDLIKAVIKKMAPDGNRGFTIRLESDVAPGTGLGSSSAVIVTLVGLLKEYMDSPLTLYEIADLAYTIERKELGLRGGAQDQYAATFGGINYIEFEKNTARVTPLTVSDTVKNELEHNLILCYTGKTRLSDNIIADQTRRFIGQEEDSLEGLRKQKELARAIKVALLSGALDDFGTFLNEAWTYKKKMSPKITTPTIDDLYNTAIAAGALGGKVTGAGGGGHMLFYCPFNKKQTVKERLEEKGVQSNNVIFENAGLKTWTINED